MSSKQPDFPPKPDSREALLYVGFTVLLLVLLGLMLWMKTFARLSEVEFYISATVLTSSVCLFRADRVWRRSKRVARRRMQVEQRSEMVVREKAPVESSAGGSWAKRIREES